MLLESIGLPFFTQGYLQRVLHCRHKLALQHQYALLCQALPLHRLDRAKSDSKQIKHNVALKSNSGLSAWDCPSLWPPLWPLTWLFSSSVPLMLLFVLSQGMLWQTLSTHLEPRGQSIFPTKEKQSSSDDGAEWAQHIQAWVIPSTLFA